MLTEELFVILLLHSDSAPNRQKLRPNWLFPPNCCWPPNCCCPPNCCWPSFPLNCCWAMPPNCCWPPYNFCFVCCLCMSCYFILTECSATRHPSIFPPRIWGLGYCCLTSLFGTPPLRWGEGHWVQPVPVAADWLVASLALRGAVADPPASVEQPFLAVTLDV